MDDGVDRRNEEKPRPPVVKVCPLRAERAGIFFLNRPAAPDAARCGSYRQIIMAIVAQKSCFYFLAAGKAALREQQGIHCPEYLAANVHIRVRRDLRYMITPTIAVPRAITWLTQRFALSS